MDFELAFERINGTVAVARSRGAELFFDTGHSTPKQGLWPMEVLVASLGGCLNLDVAAAVSGAGHTVKRLTMTITGHRNDDIPCIDRISCHINVWCNGLSQDTADKILARALIHSTIYNTLAGRVSVEVSLTPHSS